MPREFSLQDLDAMVTGKSADTFPEDNSPGKTFSSTDLDAMLATNPAPPPKESLLKPIVAGFTKTVIVDPIVETAEVATDVWDHFRKRWDARRESNITGSFSADEVSVLKESKYKDAEENFPDSGMTFFNMSPDATEPTAPKEDRTGKWETPTTMILRNSLPSNIVQAFFKQPELSRARFDAANKVLQQEYIVNHPKEFPQVSVEAAQAQIDVRQARVDPSVWEQAKLAGAALASDPATGAIELAKGIVTDPWAVSTALQGTSIKLLATGAKAARIAKIPPAIAAVDRAIGAGIAGAGVNVAITVAAQDKTPNGRDRAEIQFAGTLGAALASPIGFIFGKGAKARETLQTIRRNKTTKNPKAPDVDLAKTMNDAIDDLAKAESVIDMVAENIIEGRGTSPIGAASKELDEIFTVVSTEQLDTFFGIGTRSNSITGEIELITDLKTWRANRAAELETLFNDPSIYTKYQSQLVIKRADLMRSRQQAEAAAIKKQQQEFAQKEVQNLAQRARLQEEFDNAVEARNLAEQRAIIEDAQKLNEDFIKEASLNEADAMQAAWTEDVPTIRNTMLRASSRADKIRRRGQGGFADIDNMLALGVGVSAITAGLALFPGDSERGTLAAIMLGAITKGRPPRRFVSQGILPTLAAASTHSIRNIPEKMVSRYITRHLGKDTDPLRQVHSDLIPDGSVADLMASVLHEQPVGRRATNSEYTSNSLGVHPSEVIATDVVVDLNPRNIFEIRDLVKLLDHVADYARTIPEEKFGQYDFPRLVRETVDWDKKNAALAEKARKKAQNAPATKHKEYPDGSYWTQLTEPGQFAHESDLMGHSVRGYEESSTLGGDPTYGFGGFQSIKDGTAKIFSLRTEDNLSHVTVELGPIPDIAMLDKALRVEAQEVLGLKNPGDYFDVLTFATEAMAGKFGDTIKQNATKVVDEIMSLNDAKKYTVYQVRGRANEVPNERYRAAIDDLIRQEAGGRVAEDAGWSVRDPVKLARGEQGGFIHPDLLDLVAKGLVVTGGVAIGVALAPEDRRLQSGILGGLAGLLVPSGGTVASRLHQAGAMSLDGSRLAGIIFDGMSAVQEKALITKAKAGDSNSLRTLFTTHKSRLTRSLSQDIRDVHRSAGVDIDDIVQESFITAFEKLDKLQDGVQFYTWLYGIGKNKLRSAAQLGRLRKTEPIEPNIIQNDMAELGEPAYRVEENAPGHLDTPENMAMNQEMLEVMKRTMADLSEDKLKVFLLHEDGVPTADIAASLGITYNNATVILHRAKADIEKGIQKYLNVKGGGAASFVRDAGTENRVGRLPKIPRNQQGVVDPTVLKIAMYVGAGAALGTYFRSEDSPLFGGGLGALIGFGLGTKGGGRALHGVETALGMVDYRIKKMDPQLWKKTKEHALGELLGIDKGLQAVDPFLVLLNRLPPEHQSVVWQALSTEEPAVISKVLQAAGGDDLVTAHKPLREWIKTRGADLIKLGLIDKANDWHYPQRVKDLEGLRQHLDIQSRAFLDRALAKAEKRKKATVGESLSEGEKDAIINNILKGFRYKGDKLPGFAKRRVIPQVTPELQPFYYSPTEAMHSFIRDSEKAIQKAKFFGAHRKVKKSEGKTYTDTEESIGSITRALRDSGNISDDQIFELAGMIRDRFGPGERSMNSFLQGTKNLVSAGLLGQIYATVTQIGDGIIQAGLQGLRPSILAAVKLITKNADIDAKRAGITEYLAADFVGTDWTSKVQRASFKYSGFKSVDLAMKSFALQAAFENLKMQVKSKGGMKKFSEKYESAFTKDEFAQLTKELKEKKLSDLSRLVSFMELGRTQVMSMWDTPQMYQAHPNGRLFYHLTLFNLRAANVFREDAFAKIATGKPVMIARGLKTLVGLGLAYGIAGASTDKIKALLLNRDVEFDPMDVPLNTVEAMGFNMYDYDKMQRSREPLKEAIWARGVPPTVKVIGGILTRPPEDSVRLIPVVGRPAHEFFIKDE